MEIEILDEETIEVYTTGKSSKRSLPEVVIHKLILRLTCFKCASRNEDISESATAQYDGDSVRLTEQYRLRVVKKKHHWKIKEIIDNKL